MRRAFCIATLFIALTANAATPVAQDSDKVVEKPAVADTPEAFARQTAWIEQQMQPDGRYEFTRPADKERVRVLLGQMANLLQRAGTVAALDPNAKVELFNDQEEVNGILRHNDANRLVCESRAPVGSHIPVTHCHTFRQIEETARNTRIGMQQYDHSQLCSGGNPENSCIPTKMAGSRTQGH
jgi:hypothetical protein